MTVRILIAGCALALGLDAAGPAVAGTPAPQPPQVVAQLAAGPLRLRAEVSVHGALVTLGDLIEGAGEASGVAVFRAPDLGTAGTVRAERIIEAAAAHGLGSIDPAGIDQVLVSRVGRAIATEEIAGAIAARLVASGRADRADDVDVAIDTANEPMVVEASAIAPLTVEHFDHDARNGRFTAIVRIADSRTAPNGIRITGRAVQFVDVPVLARALERGEVISSADIVVDRMPRTSVQSNAITDPDRLVGMSARRQLREGVALTGDQLMAPILVRRGELVTVAYRISGLTLTARGRALASGGSGDVITLVNLQSNRTVEAQVTGPGLAAVLPQRMPVAGLPSTVR